MKNEKYVINIGREFGSGGLKIAEILAKKLGIQFYDKNLIEIAAQKSGLRSEYFEKSEDKTQISLLGNLSGWPGNIFSAGYYSDGFMLDESLFNIQGDIIKQLARKESCIFVGRCADYVLREHPRHINVFICAGFEDRVKEIMRQQNSETDFEKMRKEVEKIDKNRAKYYSFYTNKIWGAAISYHLCINSSALGIEGTADYIRFFAEKNLDL